MMNEFFHNYKKNGHLSYVNKIKNADEFIQFDLGESAFGPSPKVDEAIKSLKKENFNNYPDINALQCKHSISGLFEVKVDNITCGNGADEIIENIPRILLNPEDKAIVINPTFFRFEDAVFRAGGKVIHLNTKESSNFLVDSDLTNDIIETSRKNKAKIIWLCNPNNPTTQKIESKFIRDIIEDSDAFVVVDEAFYEYLDPENKNSSIKLIRDYSNMITIRTLSKAYGLAGFRFGFGIGGEDIIVALEKYRLPFSLSSDACKIATAALEDQTYLKKVIRMTKQIRVPVVNRLKKMDKIEIIDGTPINIIFLRHTSLDLARGLFNKKILVADFNKTRSIEGRKFIRITVRKREENELLIDAIESLI